MQLLLQNNFNHCYNMWWAVHIRHECDSVISSHYSFSSYYCHLISLNDQDNYNWLSTDVNLKRWISNNGQLSFVILSTLQQIWYNIFTNCITITFCSYFIKCRLQFNFRTISGEKWWPEITLFVSSIIYQAHTSDRGFHIHIGDRGCVQSISQRDLFHPSELTMQLGNCVVLHI